MRALTLRHPLSFRHALIAAAGLVLAALVTMAALTVMALAEADRLLDRLSRSQDQLARVTRIEADVNAMLLATYEGSNVFDQASALAEIERQVGEYNATIAAELGVIDADDHVAQLDEAASAYELSRLVQGISEDMAAVRQSF